VIIVTHNPNSIDVHYAPGYRFQDVKYLFFFRQVDDLIQEMKTCNY